MEHEGLESMVSQSILSARRQIEARVAGTEAPSPQTESKDSGPTPGGGVSDRSAGRTESGSAGGSDSDKQDPDTEESEVEPLPMDKVFEILKNSRRRQAVLYLKENGGRASLSELAEHIAALENDCSVRAISSSQRKRVYVGLYQCHLPKMDDMNIVDFEKNRGTVELGANATQLEPYLGETQELAWFRLYLGITGIAGVLLGVSLLGSSPFGLTPLVVLVALLIVMACAAGVHAYFER